MLPNQYVDSFGLKLDFLGGQFNLHAQATTAVRLFLRFLLALINPWICTTNPV
jgi:hypothetical protein